MGDKVSAIFEGLNSEQEKAVACVDGPVLIVAGAGSGKTRVLTSRIAIIVESGHDPARILSLTFTKKAASEMKDRVSQMVGRRHAWKIQMGTFHSVFIRFLRDYSETLGYPKDFTIYDQGDSASLVKQCIRDLKLDEKVYRPRDVLSRISSAKNSLVSPAAYRANDRALQNDAAARRPKLVDIYQAYWERCRRSGVMDFDDILFNMNILLKNHPEACAEIAARFDYIMVDEYQDTNYAQYLILRALAAGHRNICVVGDDSQSIYAFRGARVENILNFRKDYPEARLFRLEQNYRSTKVIVDAANSLIEKNSDRIPKKCFSAGDDGELITLIDSYTDKEEAMLVVSSIVSRIQSEKADYHDFAILYRTNSQSRALEEQLRRRNIPYMIYSGNSFFERAEVKDMMAYFKLVVNMRDDESFRRVVNKPARGIGDTSLEALSAAAQAHGCPLMDAVYQEDIAQYIPRAAAVAKIRCFCDMIRAKSLEALGGKALDGSLVQPLDAYALACSIAHESGLLAMYRADTSIEGQSRTENVEELLNSVKAYVEESHSEAFEELQLEEGFEAYGDDLQISESQLPTVTLGAFLENVSLLSAVDVPDGDGEDINNKVALMTAHSSKGLEFPYVYIVGMEENLFPSGGMLASPAEIQEERRLFYVALTRAKRAVSLAFARSRMRNGKTESNSPSRFIREIDGRYFRNPLPDAVFGGMDGGFSRSPRPVPGTGVSASRSVSGYGGVGSSRQGGSFSRGSSEARTVPRMGSAASGPRPASGGTAPRPVAGQAVRTLPEVEFIPSPVSALKAGQRVQHNRFGVGTIVELTGSLVDRKARIDFDSFGEKLLILKYAKVRILDSSLRSE